MQRDTAPRTNHDINHTRTSITRHLPAAARVLMGLIFVIMGLNGFLNFLPQPTTPIPQRALAFLGALYATGYMTPLVSGIQVIVGALLLANRFVPLALALIAPVIVNIICVHLFLYPAAAGPAVVVLILELYLAWSYRDSYRPMLAARATPASRQQEAQLDPAVVNRPPHAAQKVALPLDDWFDSDTEGARP